MDIQSAWQDDEKVKRLAQKVLDTEEEPVPDFFLPLLKQYMRENPYDINFIVELARKRKPTQGGNGFGTITCMESKCWTDVILDADPDRPNGGADDGFGSFFNYKIHCQDSKHISGRDLRLRAEGAPVPSTLPSSAPARFSLRGLQPSESFGRSSQPSLPSSSSPLATRDSNLLDAKPGSASYRSSTSDKGKGRAPARGLSSDPICISSDEDDIPIRPKTIPRKRTLVSSDTEDDGVEFLEGDRIPSDMVKITNKHAPIELSDDEEAHPASSVLAPLAGLPAALAADKKENAKKSKEEKAKKAAEARRAQTAAWAKLLPPASPPSMPLSQRSQPNQPPPSQLGHVNAVAGPSTMKQEIRNTASARPLPSRLPKTWWANELARARNIMSRLRRSPETEYCDPERPPLGAFVNSCPRSVVESLVQKELEFFIGLFPLCKTQPTQRIGLIERLRNLRIMQNTRGSYYYYPPDIRILELGGTGLERVWNTALPFLQIDKYAGSPRSLAPPAAGPSRTPTDMNAISKTISAIQGLVDQVTVAMEAAVTPRPIPGVASTALIGGMPGGMPGMGATGEIKPNMLPNANLAANIYEAYGYEPDRPTTEEGLSDLFRTALEDFHEDTDVDTALQGLGLQRLEDRIEGLTVQLMPHQVLGVHWMVQQEKKPNNQGGILGDMMGLGKTVQAIATMVKNPSENRKIRTTLIVLPLPLIPQWKAEIESKSGLTVYVYHGPGRTKSTNQLKNVDCVLTTYSIVANEAADLIEASKTKKKKKDDWISDDEEARANAIKKKGPLFKMAWYRIILDEAAVVRNKSTKASKAMHELIGDIRWCLTGTLIYNSLTDIYPYLRFIGIIDWEDFRERIHSIARRQPRLACRRAQAILRRVMLRRTKDSELNGRKILQLPPKTVDMVEMDFTEEERQIYVAIETAARVKVNKWYKAGTLLKQYHIVLVMLVRLRQLCCHPWLLRASEEYRDAHDGHGIVDVEEPENAEEESRANPELTDLEELQRAIRERGQAWVDKTKKKLEDRYQNMLQEKDTNEDDHSCAVCFEPFNDERVTTCHHSFCATCIDGILSSAPRDEVVADERVRNSRPCPLCRHEIIRQELYRAKAFFDPKEYDDVEDDVKPFPLLSNTSSKPDRKPDVNDYKGKGKAKAEPDPEKPDIEMGEGYLGDVGIEDIAPSTKMKKIADLLDLWHDVDPTQKTLIFCSFVEMLELMSVFLRKRNIKHVMFNGSMKLDERDEAIKKFQQSGEGTPRVMLISLKCGGVGLNLTAANNVIGLDLAWSPASEAQAVDRAHRIGQTRPVTVKRLIIRDSVEQRILALQEKKQMLADGAMGEGNGGRIGRLSAREIVALFGSDNHAE